LDIVISYMC